jgi:hypothetical protein
MPFSAAVASSRGVQFEDTPTLGRFDRMVEIDTIDALTGGPTSM